MVTSPSLARFLQSAPGITGDEVNMILELFRTVQVKAKDHIVSEGEICKQIGYVNKGCFSYYRLLTNGKKSIIHFAFEDWWTGDLQSFLKRIPATTYWQAIEDSELVCINRNDFETICQKSAAFNQLFNAKTQAGYMKALEKSAWDKSETADAKYLRMEKEYPQIILRVPHYDIAAYLGITPESLSRIRNKLSRGK